MTIKVILFDFFGTLGFISKRPNPLKLLKILKKFGCDFNFKKLENAGGTFSLVNYLLSSAKGWEDAVSLIFKKLGKKPSKIAIKETANFLKENLALKFYKDASAVKTFPFKKVIFTAAPKFIFSNFPLDNFEKILTPAEVGALKPDPKAFLSVTKIFRVLPKNILMVGDDLERDILPAKKIGMETVLIDRENAFKNYTGKKIRDLEKLEKLLLDYSGL